ncbi:SDR family NAD(P)-dependent oxidoreductase [Biformimicrobium ophioploci]|uniref:SDR family NAD(P)-dependent oxidoreductase n=1 Tax=Biformimicrobium ophioploci TaxID=3036711 RepID=A0ABQ6LUU6_9GAMM|nr:glucose 1-dehydrogenase [Microbulbifer sp. NKW57]GMG85863.1 SDR family NAD(P)-dependent oxidoreductase [Microbulbifer sp. NKW57]
MKLENKVAIVSGGARDIGKAISLKLAAEGAKVVVNYFSNVAQAEETLAEIKQLGGEAIIVQGDMTKQADVDRVLAEASNAYGPTVDVLVNVAGGLVARKTLDEMDEEFFDHVVRLNLNSTFLLTKAVVPAMDGGSIINIASQAGRDGGGPGAAAYATAKGAVMTFTRAMAKELGPKNIRVNALCPGMISTTFHDTFTKDAVRTNVAGATPLRREGKASEIADVVAFLASEESTFVTGINMDTNGGLLFS